MAPKYILHYFNAQGRAELIRWLFELKGVEYEDRRLSSEQWAEFKSKTPHGQIPVLEVDGKMLCQTNAIVLYLAQEFGYSGATPMASAEGAMVAGCVEDARNVLMASVFASSDEVKESKMKEFLEKALPKLLKFLSCQIKGKDCLTGSKMTVADLLVAQVLSSLPAPAKDIVKTFPEVQAHVDKVLALPAIKAWIEKRPATNM